MEGIPITGPILPVRKSCSTTQEAVWTQTSRSFPVAQDGSGGSVKRHGIRNLSLQGEKLSADNEASDEFVSSFAEFVEQYQIFNCDDACPIAR